MAKMNLGNAEQVKSVSEDNCVLVERDGAVRRMKIGTAVDNSTTDLFEQIMKDIQQALGE